MIADVIKSARLGALVFVLLSIMNLQFAHADGPFLTQDYDPKRDLSVEEIEDQLRKEQGGAKINEVSVEELLSLTDRSAEVCNSAQLLIRSKITSKVSSHMTMYKFAEQHLYEYMNSCFNHVDQIINLFSEALYWTEFSLITVESFINKFIPEDKKLEAEKEVDGDLLVNQVAEFLKGNKDSDYVEAVTNSCEAMFNELAMFQTLESCLDPGEAKLKVQTHSLNFPPPLVIRTCDAVDSELRVPLVKCRD